jgi:uncharacterized OB-fold protein/acyl dehydratase
MSPEALQAQLDALLGVEGSAQVARDPVNEPMIRHWCDAVEDRNPVYTDPDAAGKSDFGGIVAPPTMLQAWTMRGLEPKEGEPDRSHPLARVLDLLDEAGYTSVVATNCRQEYVRYLRPGDRISVSAKIDSVSPEKQTGLGPGRFVRQVLDYRDENGESVARMEWSLLKFKPPATKPAAAASDAKPARKRPRPAKTQDNAFFWEAVEAGELRIQRCAKCQVLRHPPGPMCPHCHSMEWDTQRMSGRGAVYSFVVAHHPPVPPFEYPNLIVLVELEEGPRLVSNLVGVDPARAAIGTPVEVVFTQVDPELILPLFRPRTQE